MKCKCNTDNCRNVVGLQEDVDDDSSDSSDDDGDSDGEEN